MTGTTKTQTVGLCNLTEINADFAPAEDNPANDYPEDEVSSDDEYGHDVYKYRQYGSEDEEVYSNDDHDQR